MSNGALGHCTREQQTSTPHESRCIARYFLRIADLKGALRNPRKAKRPGHCILARPLCNAQRMRPRPNPGALRHCADSSGIQAWHVLGIGPVSMDMQRNERKRPLNEDSPALCEWGPDVSHTIGDARPCADASQHGRDYPCAGFCVDGPRRGWIGREHCRLLCAIG